MKPTFAIKNLSILSLIFLTSCNSSSPLLDKSLNSAYCSRPTRWSTVDKSVPSEVKLKEKTLSRIDDFWSEFKRCQSQLGLALDNLKGDSGKANSEMLVNWMQEHLELVDPAIEYEFGPGPTTGIHKLDFSACGHDEVIQIVKVLVANAPKLPNWKFSAYRQHVPFEKVAAAFKGRTGREPLAFETQVNISPQNKLDVTFISPDFSDDEADNGKACLIFSDLCVGEENNDIWLGIITPKKGALSAPFSCASNAQEHDRLFEAQKKVLVDNLPKLPYFKIPDQGKEDVVKCGTRRIGMKTSLTKLGETLAKGGRFHSQQFSKCGEKFVYLQLLKAGDLKVIEKREAVEKELDAELRKAQAGCVFGLGLESPDTVYFDLCLTDLNKGVPILKRFSEQNKLSHECALRFYDSDWLNEWVGMFDDTHEPKDLAHPWFEHTP